MPKVETLIRAMQLDEERATMFGRSLNRDNRTDQELLGRSTEKLQPAPMLIVAAPWENLLK